MVMSIIAATFSTVPLSLSAVYLPWDMDGRSVFEHYENEVPDYLYKMSNVSLVFRGWNNYCFKTSGSPRTESYIYFHFEVGK